MFKWRKNFNPKSIISKKKKKKTLKTKTLSKTNTNAESIANSSTQNEILKKTQRGEYVDESAWHTSQKT